MSKLLKKSMILPVLILIVGSAVGAWFFMNPDEAKRAAPPEAQALLVETGHAEQGSWNATVEAMGQVRPAAEATLRSQVAGEIISVAEEFIPGGFFKEGDVILNIDPADYELVVKKQQAILQQAQAAYNLEMGRQSVAKDELKILERTTGRKPESPDLALRKPQLEQAQAELEKAKSDLEAAELSLSRAAIAAPFNALLTIRDASLGDKISGGQTLATLVGTDEYWVEIAVPVHDLQWLDVPKETTAQGSAATIILDGGRGERQGMLFKLTGSLDAQSRLATLLVRVADPLLRDGGQGPQLILGDYAKVMLEGKKLSDMLRVPLTWLREGNMIWVKESGQLAIRPVTVAYQDRLHAFISEGLSSGDEVVISDITVPVAGMKLRTVDETPAKEMRK